MLTAFLSSRFYRFQAMEKGLEEEMRLLDQRIILQLDQQVSEQQVTLQVSDYHLQVIKCSSRDIQCSSRHVLVEQMHTFKPYRLSWWSTGKSHLLLRSCCVSLFAA